MGRAVEQRRGAGGGGLAARRIAGARARLVGARARLFGAGRGLAARLLGPRGLTTALALAALVALLGWAASPYARYLHHEYEPSSASGQAGAIALFLAGWLLMSAATMLPAATALLRAFDARLARENAPAPRQPPHPRPATHLHSPAPARPPAHPHPAETRHRLLLLAGFLAVWLLVGYLFRAADVLVHAAVDAVGWLGARPGLVAAATLALAGAYQLTPAKRRALRTACAPGALLAEGWSGSRQAGDALRIGAAYGRSCVASCWALMLAMFGLGMAHLAPMLGLAALLAAERVAPPRLPVAAAAGIALLGASAVIAVETVT